MAKWYIPKRNEQEKDEEKDKFAQKVSDPFRTENKAQEMAESIIKTPHKSVSEGKTETNSPTNNSQPVDNTAKMQENAPTIDKPTNKQDKTSGKWYVTEGHNTNGFKTRTWESGEARAYRLGDQEEEQDEQTEAEQAAGTDNIGEVENDRYAFARAWEQTDENQSLFERYKEVTDHFRQERQQEKDKKNAEAAQRSQERHERADISKLTNEQKDLLDKYNDAAEAMEFSGFAGLTTPGMATNNVQTYQKLNNTDKMDEYKKQFMDSIGSDDEELFALYSQYERTAKNAEMREQDKAQIDKSLEADNVVERDIKQKGMSAASVGLTPVAGTMAGIETLRHISDADPDAPVDTNSQWNRALNIKNDIRQNVAEQKKAGQSGIAGTAIYNATGGKTGGADAFLYQTKMSMADSAVYMAMGAAAAGAFGATGTAADVISQAVTLPGFGLESYSTTLQEAQDRGLSKDEAIKTATVAGIAEMVTEMIPMENFFKIAKSSGVKGTKEAIIDLLKQAGLEGAEELEADVINLVADAIINMDQSEYNQRIESLINEEGMTREEAVKTARKEQLYNTTLSTIGGTISGIGFGGLGHGIKFFGDTINAKELFEDGNYAEFAEAIDTDKKSYSNEADRKNAVATKEYAEQLAAKQEAGEKVSSKEKRRLYQMIEQTHEDARKEQENPTPRDAEQSTDNVAQNTDNVAQENRRVAPVQSDITQEETVSRMSQAKTAEELGAVYNEAKNSVHEDVRKMADNLYDTYAGKLQSEGVSPEALRQGRISEQEAYEAGREGRDIGKLNPKLAEAYRRGAKETFLEEKEVTAKGAGAVTNDGSEVEISKIIDTTEGKIETSDGTILPMTEIHFRDKGMQKLYNAAMEYHSPSSAQVFIEAYPAGVPVNSYISAANEVYNRGRLGISLGDYMSRRGWLANRLGQDTIDKLYNAGKAEKEATSRENKSMEGKKTAKGGHVIDTRENKDRSHPIYRLAKDMSAKLGVDIELTENDSIENGSYNPEKARIILNMNSDNGVLNTFFHEAAGEYAEAWNNNGMGEIQDLILDWWMSTHPEEIDNLIRRYQSAYIKHGGNKSYREAANEAVNDALAGLFSTPEGINDFVEWLESDTKKNVQTQTVLERIANFIKDLIDKLNNYIKGHPEISEASRRTMQMSADQAAGLRARILDVLDEARTKAAQAETAENTDQGEIRHSVKITLPDGREVENLSDILDFSEYKRLRDMISNGRPAFIAKNGDNVYRLDNKLVYTRGKQNFGISKIILADTLDNDEVTDILDWFTDSEIKGDWNYDEQRAVIEEICGDESIKEYTNGDFKKIQRLDYPTKRNASRSDAYHAEQQQKRANYNFELEDGESDLNTSNKQQTTQSRNSLSISNVDSDGRMLSAEQQAYFKDSKIRDDQGRLITVYHGTPYGGFTVFKNDLNYFTPSQEYAERYHSPSASSIRGKYDPATNEMTYKGYLNITHPFDITDPETRNLFINDYVKGGWSASINPGLSDAEIEARIRDGIDWTEADNIKDFIDENELDYDGIILDEGAGGGYGQEVVDHGISYVTFNSNQFKNADNKNPTDNEDIRFSLEMPVETAGNLIAIHNLTTDQMRETLKLGGFPMPSIAVTRADMGHNMYGNVSVLFRKNTIDPKESRYNKVYSGDAYTPEFPNIGYKINSDKILDIRQQVKDLIGEEYELFTNTGLDTDNAKDILERNSGNVVDGYGNKDALKYAFTKAKGIDIDLPTREENLSSSYDNDVIKYLALMFTPDQALNDYQKGKVAYEEYQKDGRLQKILDKINSFEKKMYSPKLYERMKTDQLEYFKFDMLMNSIVKYLRHGVETKLDRLAFSNSINEIINDNRTEYEAWLNNLFDGVIEKKGIRNNKDMFTPSGNRRKWESLYDDFNLTNIVNAMRKEDQTGKGFGGYSFFGSVNREFDSIDDIHSEENRLKLIDQEEYSNLQKEIANELHDIALRLKPGMGYDEYSIMSDIAEAVAKRKTISGVKNFLSQWYKVSDKDIADIMGLVKRVNELPTGYFEAKPQRAVGLDEIASVVVPDLETDLIDELKDKKVPYKTYKAGDKESRKEAVNSVEDIRFSLSIDSEGRELSEEQQQFFKDSKIRDAEGRLRVVYHGTNNTEFNVFDPDYIGSASGDDGFFGRGFYFAYYPGEASYYGSRRIIPAYLNITRPFDFETELHEYKGEKAKYDYAPDAVAFMNFAEKFPEIANDMTISIARPGSYDMEDIGLIEFANAFKDVINNKEFEYQTIKNEYGEDETLVLADPKEETYEYNGKTHTHISYGFQKRFYNDAPHLDVAYAYLSSNVYSYVNMYNFTRAILDNNEEFTETLKSREYDGVIQSEGGDEAVAFYPEQIKRTDNLNPSEDPDIRYSLSGIDTDILSGPIKYSIGDDILDDLFNGTIEEVTFADEDPGSTESYRRNIDTTVANLSRMLEAANAPLRGHSVDYQRIGKIADRIKDEYNSHISKQVLTNNLTTVFDYLQNNENIDYDDITRLLTEIAAPVLEKTGVEVPEAYQHFKQYVRSMPIKLSEQQKQELAYTYGSYASARKQNFGRINFSDEGTPIDRIWPELVRESAGLLDETANAGDMAHMLIDAVENCDHGYSELEMERGQNMAEASIDLAIDIMEEYYKAEADAIRSEAVNGVLESGMAGAAARESIDKARAQMKRQQEDFRKKTKEEYDARIKELEREAGQVDYYKAMADYNETVRKVEGQKSKAEIHRLMVELANTRRDLALKTKALQKDSVMNYKQRQDAAKTRKEITRIGNDLMKRILEPTSKKHVPTDLQKPLAEFLSGIDFVSHRSKEDSKNTKTWRERMQTLSIYLSQLEDGRIEDDLGLQAVLDPDLNADIRDFIKDTEGYARVSQLDAKHLKDLLGILKRLQVAINKSDTLYLNNTYKKVSDLAVATRNELEKKKTRRPMFTMQGIAYNTVNISMLDPTSYFEEMGEAPKSVFKTFRNGFDQRAWHLKEAQEYMEKVLEGISQKDLAQWSRDKYTFNVSDGEITLTITQIMSLYELMKRDQAREHIMRGGIKADVREEGRWLKKSYTQNKPVHITPENFLTIIGKLTDEQKEVADAMQRFMANQCAEWGNHTTEQMYGYKKFTEKNYYPIKTDRNTIAANDKNTGDNGSLYHLRNLGMTKDLTPHAKNAIVLSDIFNVFSDHVADMATYDGMVMPLSDAMRWFNFKVTSEIMDEAAEFGSISDMWSIQEEIERVLGTPGKAYFTNLIKDINGMTPKAYDTQLADKLISNYKAAAVGANVRVIVQQPTAILRAANEMSPKYLARVLNPVTIAQSGKLAQKAKDNSAIAWWKGQGYFETSIGQSMRQMITGEATIGETIREYANKGAQVADDLTWGLIWRAVELETMDKTDFEYGSKEFNEAVTERFNDIVDRTQVVDTVLHRTQLMRSKSDINKLEMAFMAEPMKSYNMLHRAWKSGNKKTLARAATTFVLTNILTAAAAAIVDAFRKDDDETPWLDRYLTALKENIIDNLNPLNMFPYLKDVSSAMQGFENGRMDIEGINNLVQSLGQLEKFVKGDSKKTPYGMLKSLSKGISQLSGIPAYSLIRTFESIYNTFFDNLQTTVTSDYSYAYTAIDKNGDIEGEIQKLIDKGKNPDSIAAALTKHYKNEYIALPEEERQEMKEKLLKAYEAAGKDYEKNIDKWVTNAEKTEEPTSKNNSQDDSQNEEVAPVQEEYTSDYAGVYDAIDKGGNIQAEVQNMLDSGKQKSGVKSAITRHYKDDYLAASGSEKANMKNTLIKAYTAAGYTREEAISTIEGW